MTTMTNERNTDRNTADYRRTLSAGTLIGDSVKNSQGDNLGNLKEIMLDVQSGRVACGVLESGSFLGMGGKLFAIPFEAFDVNEKDHTLVLNVDTETLKNAEGFDKNNWPDTASREWGQKTHDYFGYSPYWQRK